MVQVERVVPTFFVSDVQATIAWYERILGFRKLFLHGDPGSGEAYGGVAFGPAEIHLAQRRPSPPQVFKAACYLRLAGGVDEYVAEIVARGQPLVATLKDHPEYGMREATVRDPDGNDLYIGMPLRQG